MKLIHLRTANNLERQTYYNWCTYNVGRQSPYTWYMVEPTETGYMRDAEKYREFRGAGALYSIAFYKEEDAVAFRLYFGL